ncbi:MFS transporter, partial [Halomonas sp. ND22Bw]|uniref:MFS transporter n=1 Tax=Halomonas sp. ND22Bw TaxID=2054178 RepID=UPI000D273436
DTLGAGEVLLRLDAAAVVDAQIAVIQAAEDSEERAHAGFFSGRFRLPILLAFLIAFFSQLSGRNFIIYYAPRVLEAAEVG